METTHDAQVKTLGALSGFHVASYLQEGVAYYVFGPPDRPVKTVCTYRKARAFAQGVAIGRIQADWNFA